MTRYTCYSDDFGGCGNLHRTFESAARCCGVHANKYSEKRKPTPCQDRDTLYAEFPPSLACAARYEEWRARNGVEANRDAKRAAENNVTIGADAVAAAIASGAVKASDVPTAAQSLSGAAAEAASSTGDGKDADAKDADAKALKSMAGAEGGEGGEDFWKRVSDATYPHDEQKIREALIPSLEKSMEKIGAKVDDSLTDFEKRSDKAVHDALAKIEDVKPKIIEVVTSEGDSPGETVKGRQHEKFETLVKLISAGDKAFLSGPAGSGKTTAAANCAKALGLKFFVQPVATDKFDALGFIDAGGTYRPSEIYRWATSEEPALLLIDEIDAWHPLALVALNPILDNGFGLFPEGRFQINSKHRVVSTANTWGLGADADYCGRNRLDAASINRFGARIEWGYDEKFEAELIRSQFGADVEKQVVPKSHAIRKALVRSGVRIVWGPRDTIGLARRVSAGFSLDEALDVSGLATLATDKRKSIIGS